MREKGAAMAEASRLAKRHGQLTFFDQGRREEEGELEVHLIDTLEHH